MHPVGPDVTGQLLHLSKVALRPLSVSPRFHSSGNLSTWPLRITSPLHLCKPSGCFEHKARQCQHLLGVKAQEADTPHPVSYPCTSPESAHSALASLLALPQRLCTCCPSAGRPTPHSLAHCLLPSGVCSHVPPQKPFRTTAWHAPHSPLICLHSAGLVSIDLVITCSPERLRGLHRLRSA